MVPYSTRGEINKIVANPSIFLSHKIVRHRRSITIFRIAARHALFLFMAHGFVSLASQFPRTPIDKLGIRRFANCLHETECRAMGSLELVKKKFRARWMIVKKMLNSLKSSG